MSTKTELRFYAGSNPARGVSDIRDDEDFWQWSRLEIRLNAFRRSTISQKQFILINKVKHLRLLTPFHWKKIYKCTFMVVYCPVYGQCIRSTRPFQLSLLYYRMPGKSYFWLTVSIYSAYPVPDLLSVRLSDSAHH